MAGHRWSRSTTRGFRLSPVRFRVYMFRSRFLRFIIAMKVRCLESLRINANSGTGGRSKSLVAKSRRQQKQQPHVIQHDNKMRCCARSNSFYADAIADCLEFIKKSSAAVSDESKL